MQQPSQEQMVKTYRTGWNWPEKKFEQDAAKLAKQGWRVHTQSAIPGPFGHARSIIVTYIK